MKVPQKTKNRVSICSSNPIPGHIPRQNLNSKRYMHPVFKTALFIIAKTWKQPKCPSREEWIKKMWYRDFPGSEVLKNPPANARDMGLSPGLGGSHMPWSN